MDRVRGGISALCGCECEIHSSRACGSNVRWDGDALKFFYWSPPTEVMEGADPCLRRRCCVSVSRTHAQSTKTKQHKAQSTKTKQRSDIVRRIS